MRVTAGGINASGFPTVAKRIRSRGARTITVSGITTRSDGNRVPIVWYLELSADGKDLYSGMADADHFQRCPA